MGSNQQLFRIVALLLVGTPISWASVAAQSPTGPYGCTPDPHTAPYSPDPSPLLPDPESRIVPPEPSAPTPSDATGKAYGVVGAPVWVEQRAFDAVGCEEPDTSRDLPGIGVPISPLVPRPQFGCASMVLQNEGGRLDPTACPMARITQDPRTDDHDKPVLLVHGISWSGGVDLGRKGNDQGDMASWGALQSALIDLGHSDCPMMGGAVGAACRASWASYYVPRVDWYGGWCVEADAANTGSHWKNDETGEAVSDHQLSWAGNHVAKTGCNGAPEGQRHSRNTDPRHLAFHLAWFLWDTYSKYGIPVDVIAHSLGGLLVRYAIYQSGRDLLYPSYLLVEDVVTFGSPHAGHDWPTMCHQPWIREDVSNHMCPGSDFVEELKLHSRNPQSGHETEWSVIGATCDEAVSPKSATDMGSKEEVVKVRYTQIERDGQGCHSNYYRDGNVDPGRLWWASVQVPAAGSGWQSYQLEAPGVYALDAVALGSV